MFIESMLETKTQVAKAALRAVANNCLMRAAGISLRLAGIYQKHIGRGVDGFNDLESSKDAARVRSVLLESAGRDGGDMETSMAQFMALYLSLATRLQDESFFKPMTIQEAFVLLSSEREYDSTEGSAFVEALSKTLGTSVEELLVRQATEQAKQSARNRDLAPIASTLLEACSDNGIDEDTMFAELPVQAQMGVFMKAIDQAANQLDRDVGRTLQYANSKSSVLRNLALSDTAAGKADLDILEKAFTKFYQQHQSELG